MNMQTKNALNMSSAPLEFSNSSTPLIENALNRPFIDPVGASNLRDELRIKEEREERALARRQRAQYRELQRQSDAAEYKRQLDLLNRKATLQREFAAKVMKLDLQQIADDQEEEEDALFARQDEVRNQLEKVLAEKALPDNIVAEAWDLVNSTPDPLSNTKGAEANATVKKCSEIVPPVGQKFIQPSCRNMAGSSNNRKLSVPIYSSSSGQINLPSHDRADLKTAELPPERPSTKHSHREGEEALAMQRNAEFQNWLDQEEIRLKGIEQELNIPFKESAKLCGKEQQRIAFERRQNAEVKSWLQLEERKLALSKKHGSTLEQTSSPEQELGFLSGKVESAAEEPQAEHLSETGISGRNSSHCSSSPACLCGPEGNHTSLAECQIYQQLPTVQQKWDLLKTWHACFRCLKFDHLAGQCPKGVCEINGCSRRHHISLHECSEHDQVQCGAQYLSSENSSRQHLLSATPYGLPLEVRGEIGVY